MTGSMSLKATAKEFIPSFSVAKPVPVPSGGVTAPSAVVSTPPLNDSLPNPRAATKGPVLQNHRQHQQQHQHRTPRQEGAPIAQANRGGAQRPAALASHPKREPQQQRQQRRRGKSPSQSNTQQQQDHSSSHGGGNSNNNNPKVLRTNSSSSNNNDGSQTSRPLNKHLQDQPRRHSENNQPASPAASSAIGKQKQGPAAASTSGSGVRANASTGNKPRTPHRSGSNAKTLSTTRDNRKGSIDHAATSSAGASTSNTSGASSSTATAGGPSGSSGNSTGIIPGMEPTPFICLTDVIHPVRHVVKDGISTMEQGSDAYLDWIVRSLKEHEEITLIGMEAAIPDIIALVLRAGKQGIGYQGNVMKLEYKFAYSSLLHTLSNG
ncbi:hypothetical protein BGZ51_000592 [Haplosporangium sp. Z 767]|nr:hypothetical protein BGZ50_005639 [Haplosporangium sp. Z 11]KAF9188428.1 hypothetical protein BGZ51_000592 [Haplosporangium sp. Z 767]